MDLLQNPFYILNVSPRDNRRRIMELSEERSLLLDSNDCTQARADLINPRKRLSMEIAWLPELSPENVEKVVLWLSRPVQTMPSSSTMNSLSPLVRANILASGLQRLAELKAFNVTKWILKLAWAFEEIHPEELRSVINEERIVSGFPEVTDLSMVEAEIRERRRHYLRVIKSVLSSKEAVKAVTVTVAVESATDNGKKQGPILINDLVDAYEVEAQAFLEKEKRNLEALVEKLKAAADAKRPDSALAPMVNQLIRVVKKWDAVAQPIQVSTKSRGLDHKASHQVAELVQEVAIHLYNKHGKLDFAQQLTNMLQEVFAEVVKVAERTAEVAEALDDIAEQRARLIEDTNQPVETVGSGKSEGGSGGKWIFGTMAVIAVIWLASNEGQNVKKTSYSPTPPAQTYSLPETNPVPTHQSSPSVFSPSRSVSSPPRSYDDRSTRSTLAREIENEKTRAKQMETQIKEMDDRLEDFERRMKSYLASGIMDEYNRRVPFFNSKVSERNELYEEYSRLIDGVNAKVRRYNSR